MQPLSPDLFVPLAEAERIPDRITHAPVGYWKDVWRRLCHNRMALIGLTLLLLLLIMAAIGPLLTPYTYFDTDLANNNRPPSAEHWFGTDDLGRDMFTRTWYGARISLFIGITAALVDLVFGVVWGGTAALLGGKVDELMMRIADVLYGLPYMLTVIMLMVVLGSGLIPIIIAMTVIGWIPMARIVRGQILQLRELEYVQAAIVLGAGLRRILFKHLVPNAMAPIIVTMTLTVPSAIFTEAFLSFLGLGIQAPVASWGTMAADALPALKYYPWRLFFPAIFISLTMLAFNLVGDGLRDALDPRQRQR
jgi:oligopeptide transport system permease protein